MTAPRIGFGVSLALHGFVAVATLGYAPWRHALPAAAPVLVARFVSPKFETRPSEPAIGKPDRRPLAKVAATIGVPSPVAAAAAEVPAAQVPAAAPAPATLSNPAPTALATTAPAPVTAPIFNASYLENPAPAYPALSRRLGEQGKVILRVLVNAGGTTENVELRDSSGHPRLDDAARDTVRRWRFIPARQGADPCAAWVLIPISFRLES